MVVWYCAFLRSGRFVSTTFPTRSILQWSRPAATNRASSRSMKSSETPKDRARLSNVTLKPHGNSTRREKEALYLQYEERAGTMSLCSE